jgi:hypothetical protein
MKRIIILTLPLFFALCSFSQVSLTLINNALTPGDSSTYVKIPFVAPGDAGPDQVWDFSGIIIFGEKMVSRITFAPLNKEKNTVDFDIILNERGSEYFFKLTEDYFMEVGGVTKDYTLIYSDPIIRMIYPFAYGNHFTDNFAGLAKAQNGQKVDFSGVYSVTADAYGTLVLPDHAYTDVLRVRTESNGIEINQCNSVEAKVIRYLWYAPGHRYPVLNVSITERRVSGKEAEITRSALLWSGRNGDTPAGKGQPQDLAVTDVVPVVVVYPNPFSDKLNYLYFLRKSVPATITLTDVTGRTSALLMKQQMQGEGLHSGSIEPADFNLNPGLYYLRFVFDKQVVVRKVIKL